MSKKKELQKKLTVQAGVALGVIAAFGAGVAITGSLAESAAGKKASAENALRQDNQQLSALRAQLTQSGDAEKRFVEIQLTHTSADYAANSNAMKDWLRSAKERYRFGSSFKLKLAADKKIDKPELKDFKYDIIERAGMRLELDAISDLHVLSFIRDLETTAPGLVRVTAVEMKREADMNNAIYRQMLNGMSPQFVSATIDFIWVGVEPKADGAAAQPGAGAPMPDPMGAPMP